MAKIDTTFGVGWGTDLKPVTNRDIHLSAGNVIRVLEHGDDDTYRGKIVLEFMTESQKNSIKAFYAANKDIQFEFDYPGDNETYDLYFVDGLDVRMDPVESDKFIIQFNVVGTQQ